MLLDVISAVEMEEDLFTQTMPLFGTRPHSHTAVSMATTRRQHSALVAIGSSCRPPRSVKSASGTPSANPFAPTYELLRYRGDYVRRESTSPGSLAPQRVLPRTFKSDQRALFLDKRAKMCQLLYEEQIARLELRCREQEKRVDLALSKSSFQPCSSQFEKRISRRTPFTKRSSHRLSPAEVKATERTPPAAALSEPPSASYYVRDSELLRALQRAEARVCELETQKNSQHSVLTCSHGLTSSACTVRPTIGEAINNTAFSKSHAVEAQQKNSCGQLDSYTSFSQRLVIL